jgi:polysaccharide biosynthesis/export protein
MRRFCAVLGLAVTALILVCAGCAALFAQQREEPQSAADRVTPLQQQASDVSQPQDSRAALGTQADYVIGPEDVLRIDVFQVPELSGLTVRVANDGTITVPLLGRINASGLTPTRLAHELQSKWGKNYLQNPEVTVFVQQFQAKPVSVVGAVEKPGLYYLTGPRTLVEVISMAGGLAKRSTDSAGPKVYVTRQGGFGDLQPISGLSFVTPDKVEIDLQKLFYSNETALNIPVRPLDIISVNKADVIYVTGHGVIKPGGFVLTDRDHVTVFQAVALAEGLSSNAAGKDARIIRQEPNGSRQEIPVNIDKVMKGQAPDPVMTANDILFVPDSTQRKALKRALESSIATVSGLLIFGKL